VSQFVVWAPSFDSSTNLWFGHRYLVRALIVDSVFFIYFFSKFVIWSHLFGSCLSLRFVDFCLVHFQHGVTLLFDSCLRLWYDLFCFIRE